MSKGSNSLLTFLIGAVAGGLMGVLYAPDKGTNTRDRLSFQLDKFKKKLDDLIQDLVEEGESLDNQAKSEGKKVVDDAKEKAEKLLDDVNGLIDQIKAE